MERKFRIIKIKLQRFNWKWRNRRIYKEIKWKKFRDNRKIWDNKTLNWWKNWNSSIKVYEIYKSKKRNKNRSWLKNSNRMKPFIKRTIVLLSSNSGCYNKKLRTWKERRKSLIQNLKRIKLWWVKKSNFMRIISKKFNRVKPWKINR